MILVDTSVWIDYFNRGDSQLESMLARHEILVHPVVIGELACGTIRDRAQTLRFLINLSWAKVARDRDVLALIENRRLMGRGLSYIDTHLLTATLMTESCLLWARDRRLTTAAAELSVAFQEG